METKNLAFLNVPVSELANVQLDCGVAVAKDLYILYIELWRNNCEPIHEDIAQKKLKINMKRLQKCAETYPLYVNFIQKNDEIYIKSSFIFKFFEQNLTKKRSRDKWNEQRKLKAKQGDTPSNLSRIKGIINEEK